MRIRNAVAAALVAIPLLLSSVSASAFEQVGHEAIEALAYNHLVHRAAGPVCGKPDARVTGKEVLRFLISIGVLDRPPCFDVRQDSIDARECKTDDAASNVWPVLGAGGPDDLYARQLGGDGQCFHFMAMAGDLIHTGEIPRLGVPSGLVKDAHIRCVNTLNTLWQEMLLYPEGARTTGRGIYSMIHSVEDSYSTAHVERDKDWRILYLKAWDVMAPEFFGDVSDGPKAWAAGVKYIGREHQHQVSDERDHA